MIVFVTVTELDVTGKTVKCADGSEYAADCIVTTIPWTAISVIKNAEGWVAGDVAKLKHTGTEIKYVGENLDTKAHWIYYPDKNKSYHRILVRHNFCPNSKGYWLETNLNRVDESVPGVSYKNEYTYPLNTVDKPEVMARLLGYMKDKGIYGLGRWGEHEHYNSDRTVERAMELFETLN